MKTSKTRNILWDSTLFHVGMIAVILMAVVLITPHTFEACSKNDMKYLRQTAEDVYAQLSSGVNIVEVPGDVSVNHNLTSVTVEFSSSSHFGNVVITMESGYPQYEEDFQEKAVYGQYMIVLCVGIVIYLVTLLIKPSKKK